MIPGATTSARTKQPLFRSVISVLALAWFFLASSSTAPAETLTNAAQVLSLDAAAAAQKIPVRITGVVTAAEPTWNGKFFVQDETSGVFVGNRIVPAPQPGDVVEVTGVTHPGSYAPIVTSPKWKPRGNAPLPEARRVPIERVMAGAEDGQRVEIEGIVRSVIPGKTHLDVYLASGGYRLHVYPKASAALNSQPLIGARVRVRGTAAASFNATLRHMLSVVLFIPQESDFIVEEVEAVDPFDEDILPLKSVAQYRRNVAPGQRMHVKGVVTFQRPGEDLFIEDGTAGLHVRSRQPQNFEIGDVVEIAGFADFDHFLPVLEDAVFRLTGDPHAPAEPKSVTMAEIQAGLHHADLIRLTAKLLDRSTRHGRPRGNGRHWSRTVLMLQHEDQVFTAEAESPDSENPLMGIPLGSAVEVTGICFTENGEDKKLQSLQLLLPSPESFRIVEKPNWLTPQRMLIGVSLLLVVLIGAVGWSLMVSKRNAVLRQLVRDRESAQDALQQAHDLLEERVKERTAQLKFQITARKESELQYKAVLSERTRLAQELHDTLEQSLTGIALQLDTTAKLFEQKPQVANRHLELARDLLSQSQVDIRRSVWDLRSRALEEFDLSGALITSARQLTDGTSIHFEVCAKGRVRPLPETIEDNLLRIAQEAMTNIIKHAQASNAEIELDYGPRTVGMRIRDNGRGFLQEECAGPAEGHFGLLGIRERVKRLGGELNIESAPGAGTLLSVQVAVSPDVTVEDALIAPLAS
ncbi:MAG TPA: histidine kinase [Verrucomicrobiae bacterium]|nr:histidine kinase [Verrucomicrobiae bacterium]